MASSKAGEDRQGFQEELEPWAEERQKFSKRTQNKPEVQHRGEVTNNVAGRLV